MSVYTIHTHCAHHGRYTFGPGGGSGTVYDDYKDNNDNNDGRKTQATRLARLLSVIYGPVHTGRTNTLARKFACKPFDVAYNLCEHSQ